MTVLPVVKTSDGVLSAPRRARVLAPGGWLYLVTPSGGPRIESNAHRVSEPEAVVAMLPELRLVSFSAVDAQPCFQVQADVQFGRRGL
jgi:hypothetical protein